MQNIQRSLGCRAITLASAPKARIHIHTPILFEGNAFLDEHLPLHFRTSESKARRHRAILENNAMAWDICGICARRRVRPEGETDISRRSRRADQAGDRAICRDFSARYALYLLKNLVRKIAHTPITFDASVQRPILHQHLPPKTCIQQRPMPHPNATLSLNRFARIRIATL